MSNPETMPWIERKDYEAFRQLSPHDEDLPDTFDQWLERATELIRQSEAQGCALNKIEVDPKEFAAWCRASGFATNSAALNAFAIKVARENKA